MERMHWNKTLFACSWLLVCFYAMWQTDPKNFTIENSCVICKSFSGHEGSVFKGSMSGGAD